MAHFRATIQGMRGEASRLGSASGGISANVNGWNGGVSIRAHYDEEKGCDVFTVRRTGGSRGRSHPEQELVFEVPNR